MSFISAENVSARPPRVFWLLFGLAAVLAADGATALVFYTTARWASASFSMLYLAAPVAALLVGIPAWRSWIVTPGRVTLKRGVLAGILVSIFAHPVMWLLLCLPALFMPQSVNSLSLSYLMFIIIWSLVYGGWATTVIGALTGMLLIVLQRTLVQAQQQRMSREAEALRQREMGTTDQAGPEVEDMNS